MSERASEWESDLFHAITINPAPAFVIPLLLLLLQGLLHSDSPTPTPRASDDTKDKENRASHLLDLELEGGRKRNEAKWNFPSQSHVQTRDCLSHNARLVWYNARGPMRAVSDLGL